MFAKKLNYMIATVEHTKKTKTYLLEVLQEYREIENNITDIINETGYKSQFIAKRLNMPLSTFYFKRKTKSFTPNEVSQIVNMMGVDDDADDAELLALAKERRNNSDRELVSVDDLIRYLRR